MDKANTPLWYIVAKILPRWFCISYLFWPLVTHLDPINGNVENVVVDPPCDLSLQSSWRALFKYDIDDDHRSAILTQLMDMYYNLSSTTCVIHCCKGIDKPFSAMRLTMTSGQPSRPNFRTLWFFCLYGLWHLEGEVMATWSNNGLRVTL